MNNPSSQGTNGMPRLSHAEAEQLISARLDAPLPHEQNRILLAHLSTCPSCRAFASRIESMTHGLRTLPMLPASPTVSRQVRERIAEGQSPWTRFKRTMVSGRWGAMPAMASALVLVAAVTFSLILRGDNGGGSNRTPIPAASSTDISSSLNGSPTLTATVAEAVATATSTPYARPAVDESSGVTNVVAPPTEEPTVTATLAPTESPEPTLEPSATPSSTATATTEPTREPSPTASSTSTPVDTATSIPEPSETMAPPSATPEPTDEPTEEPTNEPTATPTRSPTTKPTETNTPTPTMTPTDEPTATPTKTNTPEPTETNTPRPTKTPEPTATNTPRPPTRTPTPTEEPTQSLPPTIGPVGGQGFAGDEPTIEQEVPTQIEEDETPTEENTPDDSSTSIKIQPTGDETEVADEETPTTEATEEVVDASPLDNADVIGQLGSGVTAPSGGLRMPADLGLLVIDGPDGATAIVDADGNLVQSIGGAWNPVWSPLGLVLLYTDLNSQSVVVWDRDEGQIYYVGTDPGEDGPVDDIAVGWIGANLYYLRTFPNRSGYVELHRAEWNGDNDVVIWSAEGIELRGDQPLATLDGVLIPTSRSWLFIDREGNESDYGPNNSGFVGEPILSPFGSLMAYSVGSQVVVASTTSPGSPWAVIDYPDRVSGFAFSPSGEQIVVSDGASLRIYSTDGGSLISVAKGTTGAYIGHPHWAGDGIRYLEMGDTTTLMLIQPETFE